VKTQPSAIDRDSVSFSDDSNRNAFVFGFTPQAELWNGRLAMLGFAIFLLLNVISRI
jgi:Chlorophyll A-B binding protein